MEIAKLQNLSPSVFSEVKTQVIKIKSVKDCLTVKSPSIATLKRNFGEEKLQAYISLHLIDLNTFLNLKRFLSDAQINECSMMIMYEHPNLTLVDIAFVFKNAKLGRYGDLYESLSIDKIMRWFSDYFDERCNTAESISNMQHDKWKYLEQKTGRVSSELNADDDDFKRFQLNYIIEKNLKPNE